MEIAVQRKAKLSKFIEKHSDSRNEKLEAAPWLSQDPEITREYEGLFRPKASRMGDTYTLNTSNADESKAEELHEDGDIMVDSSDTDEAIDLDLSGLQGAPVQPSEDDPPSFRSTQ
jgi:tRNA isopentenyl-2-thiomethyl-A-37 hydroxylase MiaE